jgi:hypothetical protein
MTKFFVESRETSGRWQFEVDADKTTMNDLLESDEWSEGPIEEHGPNGDFVRRANGYMVYGISDTELAEVAQDFRVWFEEQGYDTDSVVHVVDEEEPDEEYEEDEDIYGMDVLDEMLGNDF